MARTTRIVLDMALGAAKNVKWFGATTWKYLKVEAVPPLTVSFFNGPAGKKLENFAGRMADGFIGAVAGRIREMDAEEERMKIERAAAIKAHEEKLKADAKKKAEERIKAAAEKAAAEAKKAKALAEKLEAEAKAALPKEKAKGKDKPPEKPKGKSKGKARKAPKKKKPTKK